MSGRLRAALDEALRLAEERERSIGESLRTFRARVQRHPEFADHPDMALYEAHLVSDVPMHPELYRRVEEMLTPNHILILDAPPAECWVCGDPTRWIEASFETRMCPGPCADEAWGRYWAAQHGVVLG